MRIGALFLGFLFFLEPTGFVVLPGAIAHAQDHQTEKIPRIGFLRAGPPPKSGSRGFSKAYRSWDMSTARMWWSNFEPPTAASISYRSLPRSW
jgi:hypothetical protein